MGDAHYSFLPWLKKGLTSKVAEADTLGAAPGTVIERPEVQVELTVQYGGVDGSTPDETIPKAVQITGPGDVLGISRSAIVRTMPADAEVEVPSNWLAYIEFYDEDFVWRYTPAKETNHKLRPWLFLTVLAENEFTAHSTPDGYPYISIDPAKMSFAFPPHGETWAWAHVQIGRQLVSSDPDALIQEVATTLDGDPDCGVSRLLCPRKLKGGTSYFAFVVPAFEAGRLAGLGDDPKNVPAQAPAWNLATPSMIRPCDFPVYFQWKFKTGTYGDFETLVTRLQAIEADAVLSDRPMSIEKPGYGLDGVASTKTVGLGGALAPPSDPTNPPANPRDWATDAGDKDFCNRLQSILNISANLQEGQTGSLPTDVFAEVDLGNDPVITPPIYGQWHALASKLDAASPDWLWQLNLNPRCRAIAGIGAELVRRDQDEFMEKAWQQIGKIKQANQKIREAQLAKIISTAIHEKNIVKRDDDTLVALTAPLHGALIPSDTAPSTLREAVKSSQVPVAALSGAFRRITSAQRPLVRRTGAGTRSVLQEKVITNFNDKQVTAAPPKNSKPAVAIETADVTNAIVAATEKLQDPVIKAAHTFVDIVAKANLPTAPPASIKSSLQTELAARTDLEPAVHDNISKTIDAITAYERGDHIEVTVLPDVFRQVFGNGAPSVLRAAVIGAGGALLPAVLVQRKDTGVVSSMTTPNAVQQYQSEFDDFVGNAAEQAFQAGTPPQRPPLTDLQQLSGKIRERLKPEFTLEKKVRNSIRVWSKQTNRYEPIAALTPVMAYPEFPEPMFPRLKQLSSEYIIPNLEKIPYDSITLLDSNQLFIEALLAGMNHEMGRELLWNEYPTDRRGSYFRRFWDVKDNLSGAAAEYVNIKPMEQWSGKLGSNAPADANACPLVLVIRGELLRKYPSTVIYAQKAQFVDNEYDKARALAPAAAENIKYPIFRGEINPDIIIYGFDIPQAEAGGSRDPANPKPGWFFVFKERPGQVSFGLDDPPTDASGTVLYPTSNAGSFNEMTWAHLTHNPAEFSALEQINLADIAAGGGIRAAAAVHDAWASGTSAHFASFLLQSPVIFARHAASMLP